VASLDFEEFSLDWLSAMSSVSQFHYLMKAPDISGSVFKLQFHDTCKLILLMPKAALILRLLFLLMCWHTAV